MRGSRELLSIAQKLIETMTEMLALVNSQRTHIESLMVAQAQNASVINAQGAALANMQDELHSLKAQVNLGNQD